MINGRQVINTHFSYLSLFSLPRLHRAILLLPFSYKQHIILRAGRSAVRLARSVRDAEVGGSNPLAPTSFHYFVGIDLHAHKFIKLRINQVNIASKAQLLKRLYPEGSQVSPTSWITEVA